MPDADGFTPQSTIELRVRVVLVGDRRHLAVERRVRRAGRRRADGAREARRAEAPPERRVEVVLREQAVRAAVRVGQDRGAADARHRASGTVRATSSSASSHVTRVNSAFALAALAHGGIEQAIRAVHALVELPHLRADVAVRHRVLASIRRSRRCVPCWTVTARLHESGQSSGHAVSTTDGGPPSEVCRFGGRRGPGVAGLAIRIRYHCQAHP